MADESNPPNDTTTPPAEGANPPAPTGNGQPPAERTFTQADVDRIVNERLARDRQRRTEPARPAPTPPPKPTTDTPSAQPANASDALAIIQLRDDFDDAISELTLDGGQRKFLRGLVMEKRPTDVAQFVTETVSMLGLGKKPAATPAAPANGQTPPQTVNPATAPSGPPVTSRSAPPPSSAPTDDTPILSMSEVDREATRVKLGDLKFAERLMKELARDNVRVTTRLV